MIDEKALRILVENEPTHFWETFNHWNKKIPTSVKIIWLKKFIKKELTKEELIKFINSSGWFTSMDEYKKSIHFLVLKDCLQLDLEEYNWFFRNTKYNSIEFNREFKLWQLNKI